MMTQFHPCFFDFELSWPVAKAFLEISTHHNFKYFEWILKIIYPSNRQGIPIDSILRREAIFNPSYLL